MFVNGMRGVYPGEILRIDYLEAFGMSTASLANALKVSPAHIKAIIRERRGISPSMALRLARYFNTTPEFWMTLQITCALRRAVAAAGETIASTIQPLDRSLK